MDFPGIVLLAYLALAPLAYARFRPAIALAATVLAADMFLPVGASFDLPGMPPLSKYTAPVLVGVFGIALFRPRVLRRLRSLGTADALMALLLLGAFSTAISNPDAFEVRTIIYPGLTLRDGISMLVRGLLLMGLPFYLGRLAYRSPEDLRDLARCLVVGGAVYCVFIAIEARLSPQLHSWVYGYHANAFGKAYRLGGWRPTVFMQSGIAVGAFMTTVALAAVGLARCRVRVLPLSPRVVASGIALGLFMTRSLAAMLYGVAILPLAAWIRPRQVALAATLLTVATLAYPVMRVADIFPTDTLVGTMAMLQPERAASLQFRFDNEEQVLIQARERAILGWGGYNRSRTGGGTEEVRATDGLWIIQFGQFGWVGLVTVFGLLVTGVVRARRLLPRLDPATEAPLVAALMCAVAIRAVDMLPNGLYSPLPFVLAGALLGISEGALAMAPSARRAGRPAEGTVSPIASAGAVAQPAARFRDVLGRPPR